MSLFVIYNPVCGDRQAKTIFEDHVIPLLNTHKLTLGKVVETTHPQHAGEVVLDLLRPSPERLTLVLGSGDGTLHEIVAALNSSDTQTSHTEILLVLVPCGTANALYSSLFPPARDEQTDALPYRLKSLHNFLSSSPSRRPLSVASLSLFPTNTSSNSSQSTAAVVVASTALHASILHDSEELRPSIPGIDRFKIAAQKNITRWYEARVKLFPAASSDSVVRIYDPLKAAFVDAGALGEEVVIEGPFAYFLSTVNVDRLEPAFRITPLFDGSEPQASSLDIVVVRPLRDPSITDSSEVARAAFAPKSGQVLGGAYRNGAHVGMKYADDGAIVEDGQGPPVAEYFRCDGWEWVPNLEDNHARLVCADGEILHIQEGGKATCFAQGETHHVKFLVFA